MDPGVERRQLLIAAGAAAATAGAGALALPHTTRAVPTSALTAYNVKRFGAAGDGGGDDTKPIQAAIDAAAPKGGIVFFPPGTYVTRTLVIDSGVHLRGSGIDATVLRLAAGTNGAIIESAGFAELAGTGAGGGITSFSLRDLTLDGAREDNAESVGIRLYAYGYELTEIVVHNCAGDGIESEWGAVGSIGGGSHEMEARFLGVRSHTNAGHGVHYRGPHDSMFLNCLAFHNEDTGFLFTGIAHGCQLANVHAWGAEQQIGFHFDALAITCANCYGDVDGRVAVLVTANECVWVGGRVLGSRNAEGEEIGIQLGRADPPASPSGCVIDTYIQNCARTAIYLPTGPDGSPLGDGGRNLIAARLFQEAEPDEDPDSFAFLEGALNPTTQADITQGIDHPDNVVVEPGFVLRAEPDEPPAPAAESVRVFARVVDGKTQLCARFAGGEIQVIGEEP